MRRCSVGEDTGARQELALKKPRLSRHAPISKFARRLIRASTVAGAWIECTGCKSVVFMSRHSSSITSGQSRLEGRIEVEAELDV